MAKTYDTTEFLNALVEEAGIDDDIVLVPDPDDDQAPKPAAPAAEPAVQPDAVPEVEPKTEDKPAAQAPSWSDDYSALKTELDYLKGFVSQKVSQPVHTPPPPSAPKPLREITDESEYAQRMEAMERTAAASFNAVKAMELQNAQRVIQELKQEIPDIDKYIPADQLHRGIDLRIQHGTVGADWREPLLKVYDIASGGARYVNQSSRIQQLEAELQKAKDDLAAKRAERAAKESELKSAGMIPAGGSVYQEASMPAVPQVAGQQRGKRAYNASAKAMLEALARQGG